MSTEVLPRMTAPATTPRQVQLGSSLEVKAATPAAMQEWAAFETHLQNSGMMNSAAWTRNWIKHYGDLVPHRLAVGWHNGRPIGMTLLSTGVQQKVGPFPIRTLHFGTAGEPELESVCVEYNRLLVADEDRAMFSEQLMQHVQQHEKWECLVSDGMAEVDAQALLQRAPSTEIIQLPCHYCDLNTFRQAEAAGKDPWRLFGESTKTNLRRAFRDLGEIAVDWSETAEDALQLYDEMIVYHQERWLAAGEPGVFSSRRFTEFHRDLIQELVPQKRAVLVRARQGEKVLGILYLLIENNRLLYYQAGLPDHKSKLSLGCVTQYLTMLEGSRRGYDAFDFMKGDTLNKRVLSTHQNTLYWVTWRRPSVKFLVLDSLRSLKNMLKSQPSK